MQHNTLSHQITARKFSVIVGLAGIAAIHIMDLPGKFAETPYLAWAYMGMIAAAAVLIERMVRAAKGIDYLAAAGLAASVFAGLVINRTVGMPGAMGDIGNWFEPLGFLSLFVETFVIWQALAGFAFLRRTGGTDIDQEFQQMAAKSDYVLKLG
ncbi:MAG: hypothetical protein ACKOWK_01465 [Micrococcales bacterium]